jgi:hypothetical protein
MSALLIIRVRSSDSYQSVLITITELNMSALLIIRVHSSLSISVPSSPAHAARKRPTLGRAGSPRTGSTRPGPGPGRIDPSLPLYNHSALTHTTAITTAIRVLTDATAVSLLYSYCY